MPPPLKGARVSIAAAKNHHHDRAVRRRDDRVAGKARLGIGAPRAQVLRIGIDGDGRRTLGNQLRRAVPQKRRAVPLPDHLRHADKRVDAAPAVRQISEMRLRP